VADKDLIRDPVQAQNANSGINANFNLDNMQKSQQAIGSMLNSGTRAFGVQEKAARQAAQEQATAQMVKYTAFLTKYDNDFKVAISQTSDPEELKQMAEEWEAEARDWIPKNLSSKISQNAANENLTKNSPALFHNAAKNRIAYIEKVDNITNLNMGIDSVMSQVMKDDKIAKEEMGGYFDQLYKMGAITEEQSYQQLEIKMKQRQRDKAVYETAIFQTSINTLNENANKDYADLAMTAGQIKGSVSAAQFKTIEDTFNYDQAEAIKIYKEKIVALDLTVPEERQILSKLDADAGSRSRYLKSVKKQVDDQIVKQQNFNIMVFQEKTNPSVRQSLDQLRSAGLPDNYIMAYQKGWNTKEAANTAKYVSDFHKKVSGEIAKNKINSEASIMYRDMEDMTPFTDEREVQTLRLKIAEMGDSTIEAQLNKQLNSKTDKKIYNEQIDSYISKRSKEIGAAIDDADVQVLKPKKEQNQFLQYARFRYPGVGLLFSDYKDITAGQRWTAQHNMEEEARRINNTQGFEPAQKFINDFFDKVSDDDLKVKAITSMLAPVAQGGYMESTLPLLEPTDKLEYINNELFIVKAPMKATIKDVESLESKGKSAQEIKELTGFAKDPKTGKWRQYQDTVPVSREVRDQYEAFRKAQNSKE